MSVFTETLFHLSFAAIGFSLGAMSNIISNRVLSSKLVGLIEAQNEMVALQDQVIEARTNRIKELGVDIEILKYKKKELCDRA